MFTQMILGKTKKESNYISSSW